MIKIFECRICKSLIDRGIGGTKRFRGTRQDVRKHLREVHNKKGNRGGSHKGHQEGVSQITEATISEEFK